MKIRKLHLKNIGVFDDEEIEFKPCSAKDKAEIHIFTGQNGSGKSTILMALSSSFDFLGFKEENSLLFKDAEYGNFLFPEQTYDAKFSNSFEKRFRELDGSTVSVAYDEKIHPTEFKVVENIIYNISVSLPIHRYSEQTRKNLLYLHDFSFAVFAFSGYRQLKSERVEAIYEPKDFNPLYQSLEFIKDYSKPNQLTINQLIANNFSKKWIESSRNPIKSAKFAQVLSSIEQAIFDITGWEIEFDLQTEPTNLIVKVNDQELEFNSLPDGLKSLISWIADLLCRVDLLKWKDDLPINEKNLILFLDEIEVHLHPAWQRKVLPVVQKLFKNSQIFISTHSPFVINSVDDAWVYKLELENGKARVADVVLSEDGLSYQTVLREIFGIDKRFGDEAQNKLDDFYRQRDFILKANGKGKIKKKDFLKLAKDLASQSAELQSLVFLELARLSKETGEPYEI